MRNCAKMTLACSTRNGTLARRLNFEDRLLVTFVSSLQSPLLYSCRTYLQTLRSRYALQPVFFASTQEQNKVVFTSTHFSGLLRTPTSHVPDASLAGASVCSFCSISLMEYIEILRVHSFAISIEDGGLDRV